MCDLICYVILTVFEDAILVQLTHLMKSCLKTGKKDNIFEIKAILHKCLLSTSSVSCCLDVSWACKLQNDAVRPISTPFQKIISNCVGFLQLVDPENGLVNTAMCSH